jgi:hypothetical protein
MRLIALVLGLVVLTVSPVAAAVIITCPQEVMVNAVGKNLPAGFTTWLFDRRAEFHSTSALPSGPQPTFVTCAYKMVQPNEPAPLNPNFNIRQDFPPFTTCSQRGDKEWECLTAMERQLRQSMPQPKLDRPTLPVPR